MLIAVCVFAAAVVVAGVALVYVEFGRYLADHSPAPPLPAEESARDHWNALAADLIAAISIVAAVAAWQAAVTFGTASDLANVALQQTSQYQSVKAVEDSRLEFSERLTQIYQAHTIAEDSLYAQAAAQRQAGDSQEAVELEGEARLEGVQARVLANGFLYYTPIAGDKGTQTFDRQAQEQVELDNNADLRTLDVAHVATLTDHADAVRGNGEELILASALLIAATLFLTIARLGWMHRRLVTALPGVLCSTAAFALILIATVS